MLARHKAIVIDIGLGNISSIRSLLHTVGARVSVCKSPTQIGQASHALIPGVGSASEYLRRLRREGWSDWLQDQLGGSTQVIGFCLGAQLLTGYNFEANEIALDLVKGRTTPIGGGRISNTGWRLLDYQNLLDLELGRGLGPTSSFFFNHSYQISLSGETSTCFTLSPRLTALFCQENLIGIQFHPEKSQASGVQLFQNVLNYG